MSDFRLVWKNLWRRKLRTLLTLVSILIAFLLFGVVRAFEGSLSSGVELAAADRLVVVNKINFTVPMPIAYVTKIAGVEGVEAVTYADWFGAYVQDPRNQFAAFAAEAESWLENYPEMILDEDDRERFLGNRRGALVGASLAHRFGWNEGDRIPLTSAIWSAEDGSNVWPVTIEGIFTGTNAQTDTSYLLLHHDYLDERRSFARNSVGWIVVTSESPSLNEEVARRIDTLFYNSANQTKTQTEKAFTAAFVNQIGNIGLIITSVVGAAFFTILFIAGNTMALSIRERRKEIAVLKTLGFKSRRIFGLVLAESTLLALAGGLPGLVLAWLAAGAATEAFRGFLPPLVVSSEVVMQSLAAMMALALLTGALPAANALRLRIVDGLAQG